MVFALGVRAGSLLVRHPKASGLGKTLDLSDYGSIRLDRRVVQALLATKRGNLAFRRAVDLVSRVAVRGRAGFLDLMARRDTKVLAGWLSAVVDLDGPIFSEQVSGGRQRDARELSDGGETLLLAKSELE